MAGFIVLLGVCSVGWQALQPVAPGPIQIGAVPPAPPFITEEGIVLQRWPTIETPQMLPTDRLTAVNGVPLATIAYDLFGRTFDRSQIAWQEGVTQQWTVLRDGEAVTIDVTPSPNPIGTTTRLATIWPQYLLVLLPTILTALIYWRQPRHASTPPLLLFGVSASVWLILSTQQMRLIYFFEPFAYFAFLIPHWLLPNLGTSAVCHLMCVFPRQAIGSKSVRYRCCCSFMGCL